MLFPLLATFRLSDQLHTRINRILLYERVWGEFYSCYIDYQYEKAIY